MPFFLKLYYLLQAAYWLQQTISECLCRSYRLFVYPVLAGKIEKPRKDFRELVAHVSDHPTPVVQVVKSSTSSLSGSLDGVTTST